MPPFLILGAFLKCATAKVGFEKNKVSQGFEALARAQCLLRSRKSLGKIALLSQVILSSSILTIFCYLVCHSGMGLLFFCCKVVTRYLHTNHKSIVDQMLIC